MAVRRERFLGSLTLEIRIVDDRPDIPRAKRKVLPRAEVRQTGSPLEDLALDTAVVALTELRQRGVVASEEIGREIQEVRPCAGASCTTEHQLHAGLPFRHLGERHT